MDVLIVDTGMSNLGSVRRAFEDLGAAVATATTPDAVAEADRLVLPGVGAFAAAMERLNAQGWTHALRAAADEGRTPILGICLGMQLLADTGEEGASTAGLGLVPGRVRRLAARDGERVPHVGWNEVDGDGDLFDGVAPGSDFYFVHSYAFEPTDPAHVAACTPYAGGFVSAVANGVVFGAQFHPEKSSKVGRAVLQNFLAV